MPKLNLNTETLEVIKDIIFPFSIVPNKCFLSTDTDRLFLALRFTNEGHVLNAVVILHNEANQIQSNLLESKYTKALVKISSDGEPLPGYETAKIEFNSEVSIQEVLTNVFQELNTNAKEIHNQYLEKLKKVNNSWLIPLKEFFSEMNFGSYHDSSGIYKKGVNPEKSRQCFEKDGFFFEVNTLLGKGLYCFNVYSQDGPMSPSSFTKALPLSAAPTQIKQLLLECIYELYP